MLLHLISDMARNHNGVGDKFAKDPRAVYAEYQVSDEEVALLASRQTDAISARVKEDSVRLLKDVAGGRDPVVRWPAPDPTIQKVTAKHATVNKEITVLVEGTSFQDANSLHFPMGTAVDVVATIVRCEIDPSTGRGTITAKATFPQAGTYSAIVGCSTGRVSEPFPNAVVVS